MTARKATPQPDGSPRKTKEAAIQVEDLLSQALKIAMEEGSVGWVTAWLDARDELEGYGYTVELQEELDALKEAKDAFEYHWPFDFPCDLSITEQMKVEQFFSTFRAHPTPTERPERFEALLDRCRGFKYEQLEQVLIWMDGHKWGDLPFGPTDGLKDRVQELERLLQAQDQDALRWQASVLELEAEVERLRGLAAHGVLAGCAGTVEGQRTVEFFRDNFADLPLEALQWIVEENRKV